MTLCGNSSSDILRRQAPWRCRPAVSRPPAVLALVLVLGAYPSPARADVVTMPIEGVIINPLIVFFGIVILAAAARLLLLALKLVAEGTAAVKGERWGLGRVPKVAAVCALLVFGLSLFAYFAEQRGRRERRKIWEPKSNLGAIRSTEVAYFAEWNVYVGNQTLTPLPQRGGHPERAPWNSSTRFSIIGFAPEGSVYCSYVLEGPDWSTQGFTARAECDFDGDGQVSVWTVNSASNDIIKSGALF